MLKLLRNFHNNEDGAVTVDWVVLTASIVAINVFAIINLIETGVERNSTYVSDQLSTAIEQR
ncbi:MAG: hypothetical protein AAGB10_01590 [Pseudomonadota bacterium]